MILVTLSRYFRRMRRHKAMSLGVILSLMGVSVLGNAACFYLFDRPHQDGLTLGDALWYSLISITTIGYGDYSAVSLGARLGTVLFVVVLGLGTFSVLLGMVIDWFADLAVREQRGMSTILAKDHILIVNFPSASRVMQLIDELASDPHHQDREIVIVSDSLETLPFSRANTLFVRGPILEQETYQRARVSDARMAIVLATSYADLNSDAVVASAVAVIDSLKPDVHIVAECMNPKHRMLFATVRCDAIVSSLSISGNLLVQEVHDPGVAQMVEVITSNVRGTTLFSTAVDENDMPQSYQQLAVELLNHDVNLMSVNRREETHTSFRNLVPAPGDRLIYAASRRLSWSELKGMVGS